MNLKKIALGVILLPAFCLSANASKQIMEDVIEQRGTPSTYSFSSQITAYADLSLEDKYKANLSNFRKDRITSVQRMESLALDDHYEDAQLYLAECYRTGVLGKSDIQKAIELNRKALEENNSFIAATMLARIFWADGDFDQAREYCAKAKSVEVRKNNSLEFIDDLLRRMNEE